MVQVVFDGSGNFDQDRAVAYAGAMASLTQWHAFNETWEYILAKHDLAYFKMAEAMTFYGEFAPKVAEWGTEREAKRDAVLAELLTLKHRYDLRVSGCGFAIGTDGIQPFPATERVAQKKKHLFQGALTALLNTLPPEMAVIVVTDVEQDAGDHYRGWIDGLSRTESAKVARIIGISFFDDLHLPAIQFADMVAWLARQELERTVQRPSEATNPLYASVVQGSDIAMEPIRGGEFSRGLELKFSVASGGAS